MNDSRDRGQRPRRVPPAAAALTAFAALAALAASLAAAVPARADIQITLQNAFIEKYKDRATIDATFTVDKAHPRPNPPSADGDLHAAGRAPEIGLATVAEVMNAALEHDAVDLIHQAERSGQPLAVRGAWRLWCEHGGDDQQVQGQPLAPFQTTNPPHVFEIHPLLRVGDQDLSGSFQGISGFTYKDAAQAFRSYEQLASHIAPGDGTTTVTTRMAGFNYVEFVIRLEEEPTHLLPDGLTVRAAVLDAGGELLVHQRRMVAVAGTAPYTRLKAMHKGEALHVVGVPRIDLALVAWRVANSPRLPGVLDWSLPYEMVLVAAFADTPAGPDIPPAPPVAPGAAAGAAGPAGGGGPGAAGAAADTTGSGPPPPVEPVTPQVAPTPGAADGDVVAVLLRLLAQEVPPGATRGACTLSSGERSYCASLTGPQCDQLGGAWNAGEDCPPPDPARLGPVSPGRPEASGPPGAPPPGEPSAPPPAPPDAANPPGEPNAPPPPPPDAANPPGATHPTGVRELPETAAPPPDQAPPDTATPPPGQRPRGAAHPAADASAPPPAPAAGAPG